MEFNILGKQGQKIVFEYNGIKFEVEAREIVKHYSNNDNLKIRWNLNEWMLILYEKGQNPEEDGDQLMLKDELIQMINEKCASIKLR